MVASTIIPVVIRTPRACKCRFTAPRIFSPSLCSSSKCRNLHTVVSSGAGSCPKSIPTNCLITGESYRASSTAGSDKLNHCCKKYIRSIRSTPTGGRPLPDFWIVRLDQRAQLPPRHHLLHLLQELRP